ncbi:PD-(D/E)XK nuclease family protein [Sulfurovum sp.]|uniref:PD-(D/E)XK nuclease family protein n=1 Tax=Sulfurovum sp. TaxID=1969726 RepID=UPI0025D6DEEB|nr:PD-(D/E)XK nuclease family protein [Sulfurovum sp.]
MRMDEFEQRIVLMEGKMLVDPLQRILLLKEAAGFEAFEMLRVDRELIRFFTKSEALFKFFEELAAEQVDFDMLAQADAYAEFDRHLQILEQLQERYKVLLEAGGWTDRMFIPQTYTLNEGFVKGYEKIEIFLEGYLSRFELELLEKAAAHTTLIIHYTTSAFNWKMLERFEACGIGLQANRAVSFDLGSQKIVNDHPNTESIDAVVYSVEERDEQVALAFMKIEEMVQSGMVPEEIVLVLPDEDFKKHFMLFDTHNNLNFAMGYDYANGRIYRSLDALYRYWQKHDKESIVLMERYGLMKEEINVLNADAQVRVERFFRFVQEINLLDAEKQERVEEKYRHFLTLFPEATLSYKEWLFLWLKTLSKITLDDVRGGKVTVMGVLETRGVSFRGVVIVDFNEGIVPATSSKDLFLNSAVRTFAGLPTRLDRESLQKQYYNRLLQQAESAAIIYSTSQSSLPSKFLYELGLEDAQRPKVPLSLLYAHPSQLKEEEDPVVETFDAYAQTWSASRLKTYLECKRKYHYRYIQNIKAKEEDELNEGAFLHTLLEHLYKEQNCYANEAELTKRLHILMDTLLPDEDAKSRYRKLLWREKLKGFVEKEIAHFKAEWHVAERELEVSGEIGGLKFKGRIDRIDQNATDTLVLDYKSGRVEKEPKRLNPEKISDFQMSIYHQLLQKRYQNISLAFVKILEKGEKQQVTLLEERNELLGEHIVKLKQTKSFVAEKCDDLQKCIYCEFALMCGRGEYL